VLNDPAVQSISVSVGGNGPGGGSLNVGRMFVALKPLKDRPGRVSADAVVNRLRRQLTTVPGAVMYLQAQQEVMIGGRGGAAQYQYTLSDEDIKELNTWAPSLMAKMRTLPELRDVSSDQQVRGLAENLVIDRDQASRLGLTASSIDQVLYDAFGQRQVSTMYSGLNQYHVVMEVDPQYQSTPDSLNGIFVKSTSGQMIPLSTIAHFERQRTSLTVNHQGQYPAITLVFNLAPNVALSQAVNAIERAEREMNMPSTVHTGFQGTAQVYQDSLKNQIWLVLAALTAVYIVLGILYESLIHPLTILSTLPPAGVGAILALMLTGTELNIIAMIGIILLIGIVKKNAILMIDFALQAEREDGLKPVDAIRQACLLRFRPIVMTTMAALFGGLPMAIGMGVGSELRKPMGIAIVGGLIVSQMLTLFTTPVVYLGFDKLRWWLLEFFGIKPELAEAIGEE